MNEVYRYLYAHMGISSQQEFAKALRVQRTALSAAMNGNKAYLTRNLFMKVCAAFPGVFSIEYLLTGEGSLLLTPEPLIESTANDLHIIEIYAKVIKDVELLNHQLKEEIAEVRRLKEELVDAVSQFRNPYKQQSPDYPIAAEAKHTETIKNT